MMRSHDFDGKWVDRDQWVSFEYTRFGYSFVQAQSTTTMGIKSGFHTDSLNFDPTVLQRADQTCHFLLMGDADRRVIRDLDREHP